MAKMSKLDLEAAQFILGVYGRASKLADRIDPKRTNADDVARILHGFIGPAKAAFWSLTGRWLGQDAVTETDLNTEHPAEWTKNVEQNR